MGTWLKRPDANGAICGCLPAVCDPCDCRYFGAYASGYYVAIAGYSDSLFPGCDVQSRTEPAWSGRFAQVFGLLAPCEWQAPEGSGSASYHGATALLSGARLFYNVSNGPSGIHSQPSRTWSVEIFTPDNTAAIVTAWYGESGALSDEPNGAVITRKSGCGAGPASITLARVHP